MAITEKINTLRTEKEQRDKVVRACGILREAKKNISRANGQLQLIADSGSFDTVDPEIKNALLASWNIVKDAATAFETAVPTDLLAGYISSVCQYCGQPKMQEQIEGGEEVL